MILRFGLGVGDAGERGEELLRRVDDDQPDAGRRDVVALDLLGLALAQQPVVDEHAGELVADRAVHERGRDRGVDAAGEPAEHVPVADLRADPATCSSMMLAVVHVGVDAGDVVEEVLEHLVWPCSVCSTSGWHWTPEAASVDVLERGDAAPSVATGDRETRRGGDHGVAVRHPHRLLGRQAREQQPRPDRRWRWCGRTRQPGALDRAAERLGHRLEAVADAEHRDPGVEQRGVDAGRTRRRRPTDGPPDRMIAAGCLASISATGIVCGTISL